MRLHRHSGFGCDRPSCGDCSCSEVANATSIPSEMVSWIASSSCPANTKDEVDVGKCSSMVGASWSIRDTGQTPSQQGDSSAKGQQFPRSVYSRAARTAGLSTEMPVKVGNQEKSMILSSALGKDGRLFYVELPLVLVVIAPMHRLYSSSGCTWRSTSIGSRRCFSAPPLSVGK